MATTTGRSAVEHSNPSEPDHPALVRAVRSGGVKATVEEEKRK
jgi:hypothetical protein